MRKLDQEMNKHLELDENKIEKLTDFLLTYLRGDISKESAKKAVDSSFDKITAQEFALCEQSIGKSEIDDDELTERIEELITIVKDRLVTNELDLAEGHPIDTYLKEVKAIRNVLDEIRDMKSKKFIKNEWLEI